VEIVLGFLKFETERLRPLPTGPATRAKNTRKPIWFAVNWRNRVEFACKNALLREHPSVLGWKRGC